MSFTLHPTAFRSARTSASANDTHTMRRAGESRWFHGSDEPGERSGVARTRYGHAMDVTARVVVRIDGPRRQAPVERGTHRNLPVPFVHGESSRNDRGELFEWRRAVEQGDAADLHELGRA